MNKSQLTNFYYDMSKNFKLIEPLNNNKNIENSSKLHKKNKSLSTMSKENRFFDWKLANKILIN